MFMSLDIHSTSGIRVLHKSQQNICRKTDTSSADPGTGVPSGRPLPSPWLNIFLTTHITTHRHAHCTVGLIILLTCAHWKLANVVLTILSKPWTNMNFIRALKSFSSHSKSPKEICCRQEYKL